MTGKAWAPGLGLLLAGVEGQRLVLLLSLLALPAQR